MTLDPQCNCTGCALKRIIAKNEPPYGSATQGADTIGSKAPEPKPVLDRERDSCMETIASYEKTIAASNNQHDRRMKELLGLRDKAVRELRAVDTLRAHFSSLLISPPVLTEALETLFGE